MGWCLTSVLAAAIILFALPSDALPFRGLPVGAPVPSVVMEDSEGRATSIPVKGAVSIVIFWRADQQLSDQALDDLAALATRLGEKKVPVVAVAEPGTERGTVRAQAARWPHRFVADVDGRAAQAFGLIVLPSTGVIGTDGKLRYYLPSRTASYRGLIEAEVLHARGEISDPELSRRLLAMGDVEADSVGTAQVAYKEAVRLIGERRWEEARRALTDMLARAPEHQDALLQLGYVELELGHPAQALRAFDSVLVKSPTSPRARVGRGIARLRMGDTEEGIRLLEQAVVLNPEPVRAHWELASAYERRGETARALEHYRWAYQKLLQGRK